jgi:hypothetical protein
MVEIVHGRHKICPCARIPPPADRDACVLSMQRHSVAWILHWDADTARIVDIRFAGFPRSFWRSGELDRGSTPKTAPEPTVRSRKYPYPRWMGSYDSDCSCRHSRILFRLWNVLLQPTLKTLDCKRRPVIDTRNVGNLDIQRFSVSASPCVGLCLSGHGG